MKNLMPVILIALITSCGSGNRNKTKTFRKHDAATDSIVASLSRKKKGIDKYLASHQDALLLFAKLAGKDTIVPVKNGQWPDSTEYSYNVLKDASGRIILIGEVPFSESGDWNIEHRHYFDNNGNTFEFTKEESRFTDQVPGGIIWQKIKIYYDGDFNIILQTNKLTDKNDRVISGKKNEYDFMDDQYKVYKNVNDCIKAYHLDRSVF